MYSCPLWFQFDYKILVFTPPKGVIYFMSLTFMHCQCKIFYNISTSQPLYVHDFKDGYGYNKS